MRASAGDHIKVPGLHVGDPGRVGEVVEVRGADGAPPYVVRWADGHEAVFIPGAGVTVEEASSVR